MPGWKFGPEDEVKGSTYPSILDLYCLTSVALMIICAVSGREVIGDAVFFGFFGLLGLTFGGFSVIRSLVKERLVPVGSFLLLFCFGLTLSCHALISGSMVTGWLWPIWLTGVIAGITCLFRVPIWKRLYGNGK